MDSKYVNGGRRRKLAVALLTATVLFVIIAATDRAGLPNESLVQDSDAIYLFAAGAQAATNEQFERLRSIVNEQSAEHGHEWVSDTIRQASFPSDAPWRRLVGRIPAPEQVLDDRYRVLLTRTRGILRVIAAGCGSNASDFEVHITSGRGISAYSMADGSIYISHALAASDESEVAFALAHEIRHLRACHYRIEGSYTWSLEEDHIDAFTQLAEMGFEFLIDPAEDYYSQESECDAYGVFIAAYCGFEPEAALSLIAKLPEGDGRLYPSKEKREKDIRKVISFFDEDDFSMRYMPARYASDRVTAIVSMGAEPEIDASPYLLVVQAALREAAALDLLMMPADDAVDMQDRIAGLFETKVVARIEARARHAVTVDIAVTIEAPGVSGMSVAVVAAKALMIEHEDGWRLVSSFDTPGRSTDWSLWQWASDMLPQARKPNEGDMEYAIDALSAWKVSFTTDVQIHSMCYSRSGVQPYFDNGDAQSDVADLLALSGIFSSIAAGSEMRIFDITANKAGKGFISIGFGYSLLAGGLPVMSGSARLGMVPERGGWAVAGVGLF